jgi:hypothetical protein
MAATLEAPDNSAYLMLVVTPAIEQTANQLRVTVGIEKELEVTSGGFVGVMDWETAEMESSNPVVELILEGPNGYHEAAANSASHTFTLPATANLQEGQFRLVLKTKFFAATQDFAFQLAAAVPAGRPMLRFTDNALTEIKRVATGDSFRLEVTLPQAGEEEWLDVVLKNRNRDTEDEIACRRTADPKVYRSDVLIHTTLARLQADAGHVLQAEYEGAQARLPVSLRWVKIIDHTTQQPVPDATFTEVGGAAIAYDASNRAYPVPALAAGSHDMQITRADYQAVTFSLGVGPEGAVNPLTGGRSNFTLAGSTLTVSLDGATGIYTRFLYFNRNASANQPLPERVRVCLMDYNPPPATDREVHCMRIINPRGDVIIPTKVWEDDDDLYFKVFMQREKPDVQVQYGATERDVEWSTKANQATNGYFENLKATHIGLPSQPIVYTIQENDLDNDGWSNDACFIIRTIQEIHQWYVNQLNIPWDGVEDLDAEIGVAFESWSPPTSNTIALNDARNHQWDRGTIAHEYSHQVMYNLSHNPMILDVLYAFIMGEIPSHYMVKESHPDTAMLEGWAEFIEWAFTGAPAAGRNRFWLGEDGNGTNNSGEVVEGAVANALFDINALVVAGNRALFTDIFWRTIEQNPEDVKEFHDVVMQLSSLTAARRQQIKDIFQDNGIVYSRLKLTQHSQGTGTMVDFGSGAAPISRTRQLRLIAKAMSASELHTNTIPRDVSDTDEVRRGHVEILTVPLANASDVAGINTNLFNAANWRRFSTVGKNDQGEFIAQLDPSALGLAPGFYAIRVQGETTVGTLDHFGPALPAGGAGALTTAAWHRNQGIVRVIQVTP